MSSVEEAKIYAQFQDGINKIKQGQALFEAARKELGLCKICDEELAILAKASGDLSTVTEIAVQQMRMKSMEGLKTLPSVAAGLDKLANEARDAASVSATPTISSSSEESLGLFPDFLRPTKMIQQIKNGNLTPTMPHEVLKVGSMEPRGAMQRPPLPHELLGLDFPLPGKMFRQMTTQK